MTTKHPTDGQALYQLMTWLSPSYPVGAYTYSHALEYAVESGTVSDRATTQGWITDIISHGDGFADAVFLAEAYRSANNPAKLADVAEYAVAFVPTKELALESEMQGAAFLDITQKSWPGADLQRLTSAWNGPYAYPVVIGVAAEGAAIPLDAALTAYSHAFAANLVSAAVRLIPLGQTDGQHITASLLEAVQTMVQEALLTPLDLLATSTFMADIASMKHETQYTRLFRS